MFPLSIPHSKKGHDIPDGERITHDFYLTLLASTQESPYKNETNS